ncbi:relaxase/mobilization nuclease domain-containing protein [Ferrovum myxofaciens]|uniref:relaxase/mobilization nuclease domain-containing protein n=1 Tax=Ferrovum myxofaciens TaxID=416213 RepID=UPI00235396D1|nr:relaxase/mobilization nuclease domain-containing protein [Ferrovum myxofaciens]MBU6994784.1 relaxase/mobilization nuclease domain-containing protein [Ferrovum myxofaciens]
MKAMHKIRRGRSFKKLVAYLLNHDSGRQIGGASTAELVTAASLRTDIEKPVWHSSLSLPAGEHIDETRWNEIATAYLGELGFSENNPRAIYLHDKPGQQHIHIVCSRVSLAGEVYLGKNENLKSTKITAELEKRFGLKDTQNIKSEKTPVERKIKKNEIEKAIRTLTKPARLMISEAIATNSACDTEAELFERLEKQGITASLSKNGKPVFEIDGLSFSRTKLGLPDSTHYWKRNNDKTNPNQKPANPGGNVTDRSVSKTSERENQTAAKKGLVARKGRRATEAENRNFQNFLKEHIMDTQEKPAARLFYNQRTPLPIDPENLDHGWVEYKDRSGRIWFYPAGEQPHTGNRAGYAFEQGTETRAPGVLVFQDALEKGVNQAARDAVRIAIFKGLPHPLKISGSEDFQRAVMREMFTFNIELENKDGPARDEYNKLCKQKHEERLGLINRIDGNFREIDHKVIENKKAAIANIDTNKLSQKDKPAHGNRMKQ